MNKEQEYYYNVGYLGGVLIMLFFDILTLVFILFGGFS